MHEAERVARAVSSPTPVWTQQIITKGIQKSLSVFRKANTKESMIILRFLFFAGMIWSHGPHDAFEEAIPKKVPW